MTRTLMVGHGADRTHYVERAVRRFKHGQHRLHLGPACRNRVADFEINTGGEVTCGTCAKLPGIPARAQLLQESRDDVPLRQCWRCNEWRPTSELRAVVGKRTRAWYCDPRCADQILAGRGR